MRRLEIPFLLLTAVVLLVPGLLLVGCTDLQIGQSETTAVPADGTTVPVESATTVMDGPSTSLGPGSTATGGASTSSSTTTTKAPASATGAKPPVITGLNPDWGALDAQGAKVIITGSGFTGVFSVTFRGVEALDFRFNSDNQITAYAPILGEGTVDVRVITPAGMSQNTPADDFTYVDTSNPAAAGPPVALLSPVITSLSPGSAEITSGTTRVIIAGSGFDWSSQVYFGGELASAWVVDSDTKITAYAAEPPGPGTVDVQVVTDAGQSANTPADDFTWLLPHPPAP
jgi:hypothetical protein